MEKGERNALAHVLMEIAKVGTSRPLINVHHFTIVYFGCINCFYQCLFAEFVHTDRGTTCSDYIFKDLSNYQECVDAVEYAKSFNRNASYVNNGNWARKPTGCYIYDDGEMFFNHNLKGENQGKTRSICKNGNRYL